MRILSIVSVVAVALLLAVPFTTWADEEPIRRRAAEAAKAKEVRAKRLSMEITDLTNQIASLQAQLERAVSDKRFLDAEKINHAIEKGRASLDAAKKKHSARFTDVRGVVGVGGGAGGARRGKKTADTVYVTEGNKTARFRVTYGPDGKITTRERLPLEGYIESKGKFRSFGVKQQPYFYDVGSPANAEMAAARKRLTNFMSAAEHLQAAGAFEEAKLARDKAMRLRKQIQDQEAAAKERMARARAARADNVSRWTTRNAVADTNLKNAIGNLHEEVRALRKEVGNLTELVQSLVRQQRGAGRPGGAGGAGRGGAGGAGGRVR